MCTWKSHAVITVPLIAMTIAGRKYYISGVFLKFES